MHLRFQRDIGPDGKRRFTDCHTCLAFEYASKQIGEGVVPFSLAMFIDGTYQLKNVATLPVYITTRNYDKSIQNQPSAWRLLAVIPYYKLNAGTLSPRERTYRRREVSISPPLVHLSPFLVHDLNNSFEQLLHDCLAVLLKEVSDLPRERYMHWSHPVRRCIRSACFS